MLNAAVQDYMALRHTAGFKCVDTQELLQSYAAFAMARGDENVCVTTAVAWAKLGASPQRCHRRLRTVGLFAEHLRAEDRRHDAIPRDIFPLKVRRHPPRLFNVEEIEKVLRLADTLKPSGSIRPLTYRTLFGLLFVSGMRISEALRLRFEDVSDSGVMVRQTKFRKSRWLPLHASTLAALERYLTIRRELATHDDHLFVSLQRRLPLHRDTVLATFQTLCAQAGITGAGGARKPRLHDLRHSFAAQALARCGANRDQVDQHMLALSTYLGHSSIESTYWYLEQTPELLRDIATACENGFEGARS